MYSGILFGFLAAFSQSISYLCTRIFVKKHSNDILKLFALSHIIMGIISIPLAIFLMPEKMPEFSNYALSLLGSTIFYILGQLFLFFALTTSDPSRVSPLLGLKVFILAIIGFIFLHQSLSLTKWIAVILSSYSAFLLSSSGKKLNLSSIALIILACFSFCISDLSIKALVDNFKYLGVLHGAVLSSAFCYILCGFCGTMFLFFTQNTSKEAWLDSIPFAFFWFIAMIFLFSCFAVIGVVFGNIIQSTRGIISIVLGYVIANFGFELLETKITKKVFIQRILAALLMTASIALFYYSK